MWYGYDDLQMYERHRTRLEEAEHRRQIHTLLASRKGTSRYVRAVGWLGRHLSAWGAVLEARADRSAGDEWQSASTWRTGQMR